MVLRINMQFDVNLLQFLRYLSERYGSKNEVIILNREHVVRK